MWEFFLNWNSNIFESLNSLEVNLPNSIFRLIISMLLGMIVGAERKRKGQTAGIRTFALISMGACLAMLLSIYVPQEYMGLKNGDPGRIAAQVITGIGFLGGGAMIQMRGTVKGLTTAAGIWITAIIGMAVGIGMYIISFTATALVLITLITFEQYSKRKKIGQESKVINITVEGILKNIDDYQDVLRENEIHLSTFYVEYDYENQLTELNFVILVHSYTDVLPVLNLISKVTPTRKLTLSNQIDI
ncbi:MAG: MgtC/SapB family protein [Muribaculaceae bacterium]|nr:MgtC/SapB family protein [Muribaculaceae bacterium]